MSVKTLIFFIDGATWDLLNPWIDNGFLPNFKKLKDDGAHGYLESVIPPVTHAAMPSFFTGQLPADLGFLYMDEVDAAMLSSNVFANKTYWDILDKRGFSSLIVDLPFTYPPRPFNGVLFTGFYTPNSARDFVYPNSLALEYPDYPKGGIEIMEHLKKELNLNELYSAICEITEKRFQVFFNELKKRSFDTACFYIKATDIFQHYLWNQKDKLLDFYKKLDGYVEKLCSNFEIEDFVVLSDHGFNDAPRLSFNINAWLHENGFLVWKKNYSKLTYRIARYLMKRSKIIASLAYNVRKKNIAGEQTSNASKINDDYTVSSGIDMEKTKAYAIGGTLRGKGIFVNKNLVSETEQKDLTSEIIHLLTLAEYKNTRLVETVQTPSQTSIFRANVPDIVFLQTPKFIVDDRYSRAIVSRRITHSRAKGHHLASLYGIFIWHCQNIERGEKKNIKLLDIFPTILHKFGIEAKNVPGRVINEIFKKL